MNTKSEKEYVLGDHIVVWKSDRCIHSTICFHGLPEVFNPSKRPWVNVEGAEEQVIIQQVKSCPSGALSIKKKNGAV